jgi:hypothetical protein
LLQAMSSADLISRPVGPNAYCLIITGGQANVEAAKSLATALLGTTLM